MKKYIIFIISLTTCCILSSCEKNDVIYSCNPKLNKLVSKNTDVIKEMSSNEVLSYRHDVSLQKAIYNALTSDQKLKLWKKKLDDILLLEWTEKEINHIELMLDILESHTYLFEFNYHPEFEDEIDLISYKWVNYAKEELRWDNNTIYAVSMTINPVTKINGELIVDERWSEDSSTIKTKNEIILACKCSNSGSCPGGFTCMTGSCERASGCGFGGFSKCVGLCQR